MEAFEVGVSLVLVHNFGTGIREAIRHFSQLNSAIERTQRTISDAEQRQIQATQRFAQRVADHYTMMTNAVDRSQQRIKDAKQRITDHQSQMASATGRNLQRMREEYNRMNDRFDAMVASSDRNTLRMKDAHERIKLQATQSADHHINEMNRLENRMERFRENMRSFGPVVGGAVAAAAGVGMLAGLNALIRRAEDLNKQTVRMQAQRVTDQPGGGIPSPEVTSRTIGEVNREAFKIATTQVRGVSPSDITRGYSQLQGLIPHDHLMQVLPDLARYIKVSNALSDHPKEMKEATDDFHKLFRAGELMGRMSDKQGNFDIGRMRKWLDAALAMKIESGGLINEGQIYQFAGRAGIANRGLSDRALYEELALIGHMGGFQAGTARMSEYQQWSIGRMPKAVANLAVQYGILKPGAVKDAGGDQAQVDPFGHARIHGLIGGTNSLRQRRSNSRGGRGLQGSMVNVGDESFVDPELARLRREEPAQFYGRINENLLKQGITDLEERIRIIGGLSGRATTFRRAGDITANAGLIRRTVESAERTEGLKGLDALFDNKSVAQARENLNAAWTTLIQAFIGPDAKPFVSALNTIADGMRKLAAAINKVDPTTLDKITSGLLYFGTALAIGGSISLALGVGGWMLGGFSSLAGTLGAGTLAAALAPTGWLVAGVLALSFALAEIQPFMKSIEKKGAKQTIIDYAWRAYDHTWKGDRNAWSMELPGTRAINEFLQPHITAIEKTLGEFIERAAKKADKLKEQLPSMAEFNKKLDEISARFAAWQKEAVETVNGWYEKAKVALADFATKMAEEIKSLPGRLMAAILDFGNRMVGLIGNAFQDILKGIGKGLGNPAGPGANPHDLSNFEGGSVVPYIQNAVLSRPGSANDNHVWSDIGQGKVVVHEGQVRDLNRNTEELTNATKRLNDTIREATGLGSGTGGSSGGFGGGGFAGGPGHFGSGGGSHTDQVTRALGGAGGNILSRQGGSRSWRNNNPGNIEYGAVARSLGAIGSDGRFAIFPTYDVGRKAQERLLFDSKNYRDLTLAQAIHRWAPASENNVPAYIRAMGANPQTRMSQFSPEQRKTLMDAMQRHEGWRPGIQYGSSGGGGSAASRDLGGPRTRDFSGLRLKSRETVAGGGVHPAVTALAHQIQSDIPGFRHFSALNDGFHQAHRPHSLHRHGMAVDFSMGDWRQQAAAAAKVRQMMAARGVPAQGYELINHQPGDRRSTAPHVHVGFRSRAAADAFTAPSHKARVPPPNDAGTPTVIQNHIHMDGRKVGGSVTRHQGEFANGPSLGGQGFDRSRQFAGADSAYRTAA